MSDFLKEIANRRKRDPLAPVTVVVPSHVAGLQLRRRLAEDGPFANVRFETLPRIAELLGAGDLARANRKPLARPIGDFVAAQVAREAQKELAGVRDLPGFARVLRFTFLRLRRGGFRRAEDVPIQLGSGLLYEVVRLYGLFRTRTSDFYDTEDLLDAAATAVRDRRAVGSDLGDVYVVPPGALSASVDALLSAIKRAVGASHYHLVSDDEQEAERSFVLAPDPASEAREVAREVLAALEAGYGLHEIGVFHGADPAYRTLLNRAFEAAEIPVSAMPGTPLSETPAGRGVLMLAELPLHNYSRTKTIDFLSLAPLRDFLPAGGTQASLQPARWRRIAREAGITQGIARWDSGIETLIRDLDAERDRRDDEDERRVRIQENADQARELGDVIATLASKLQPLQQHQPAAQFIEAFRAVVEAYFDPTSPTLPAVLGQIDQLGTIDAVGGSFSLESFVGALRANLEVVYQRDSSLGQGVFVADYRMAAGLSFRYVALCGAYEGVFPAGPRAEELVEDRFWQDLRASHPFLEDAALRSERSLAQARRAMTAASERLTWTAPLQASSAGREHYPSHLMFKDAHAIDASIESASALRRTSRPNLVHRPPSPLAAMLTGRVLDLTELRMRDSMAGRRDGRSFAGHAVARSLDLLNARRGAEFSAFDGNLSELAGDSLIPSGAVSPTSLEHYGACGYRYFLRSVLRLRPPEEPEDRETIDPLEKGNIVHNTLDDFYKAMQARGRPAVNEPWTEDDRIELLEMLEARLDESEARGRTGLRVFSEHERRRLRADLAAFLEHDTEFRIETGARPTHFEVALPEDAPLVAGLRMRGYVDRIDMTEDGKKAWVIDYKTGSTRSYEGVKPENPLADGTKLQLPVYLAAVPGAEAVPMYWFISSAGGFQRMEFLTTDENMQRYEETLSSILDGLKRGTFPAVPGEWNDFYGVWDNCNYCDFKRLCSRRRDEEFEDKRGDPSLQPWLTVGVTARGEVTP